MIKETCKECGKVMTIVNHGGEFDCKECELLSLRVSFEHKWNNGGSFMKHLCEAIVVADVQNTDKLYLAFPDLVDGYSVFARGRKWGDR